MPSQPSLPSRPTSRPSSTLSPLHGWLAREGQSWSIFQLLFFSCFLAASAAAGCRCWLPLADTIVCPHLQFLFLLLLGSSIVPLPPSSFRISIVINIYFEQCHFVPSCREFWINYALNRTTMMHGGSMDALLHGMLCLFLPTVLHFFSFSSAALQQHHCRVTPRC